LNTHVIGLKALLDNALSQLNELQRSAILLRDYEGYSYLEIGDILDLNESQVKIQIFRGRKKLQNIIGSVEDIL
jgi:RNA polymerase sigma-70 factor (ECF subfamily)